MLCISFLYGSFEWQSKCKSLDDFVHETLVRVQNDPRLTYRCTWLNVLFFVCLASVAHSFSTQQKKNNSTKKMDTLTIHQCHKSRRCTFSISWYQQSVKKRIRIKSKWKNCFATNFRFDSHQKKPTYSAQNLIKRNSFLSGVKTTK